MERQEQLRDVPADCPTRERHGWVGDSRLFAITAGYLMNYIPFAKSASAT